MMRKSSALGAFTLLELLVTVVILSIIASAAVVGYKGYQDRVAMMVDQTNQKIIAAALKVYASDTGALAGEIGQLRPSDLDRAYALVTEGKQPYTMLAYAREVWQGLRGHSVAEAANWLPVKYVNSDLKVFHCPKETVRPILADDRVLNSSYGVDKEAAYKPLSWLQSNPEAVLVIEVVPGAQKQAYRHGWDNCSIVTTAGGRSGKEFKDRDPQREEKG